MSEKHIFYRAGYRYQLAEDYVIQTRLKPKQAIDTQFIDLTLEGLLTVKKDYAWDGTSGPVIDTKENHRASLVHDALYQLMRQRLLSPRKNYKDKADKLFRSLCKKDGVPSAVAQIYYQSLKKLGNPSTDPKNAKPVLQAP